MIKRIFAAFLLSLTVLCAGCGGQTESDEFDGYKKAVGFKASVSAEGSGFSFSFDLIRQKPDKLEVTFTGPSTLKNFRLFAEGEELRLSFYGFDINLSRLPVDIGGVRTVLEALKQFDQGLGDLELKTRDNDYIIYGGPLGDSTVEFTLRSDTFSPVLINISGTENYTITITDFSLITEPLESTEGNSKANG